MAPALIWAHAAMDGSSPGRPVTSEGQRVTYLRCSPAEGQVAGASAEAVTIEAGIKSTEQLDLTLIVRVFLVTEDLGSEVLLASGQAGRLGDRAFCDVRVESIALSAPFVLRAEYDALGRDNTSLFSDTRVLKDSE